VDAPNARVGDPCSELTIVVRNGSDHQVRVALTTRLRFGPGLTTASMYVATPGHAEHVTVQYVRPGDVSNPYTVGFVLPVKARENVQLRSASTTGDTSEQCSPAPSRLAGPDCCPLATTGY
jgi:hypothetical protein